MEKEKEKEKEEQEQEKEEEKEKDLESFVCSSGPCQVDKQPGTRPQRESLVLLSPSQGPLGEEEEELEGDHDHELGAEEVDLGDTAGHDVGPAGEEVVTLAGDGGGGGIEEDRVAVDELADGHGPTKVVAEGVLPLLVVAGEGLVRVVALGHSLGEPLGGNSTSVHGMVNALPGHGVNHACGIAHNQKLLVVALFNSSQPQGAGLHVLDLEVLSEGLGDMGILL